MEVRNLRLCDLDFDRKQLKVVQEKAKKDRYLPLSEHLIRGLKKYIEAEKQKIISLARTSWRACWWRFRFPIFQRGVQWAIKQASKTAKILKEVECSYASAQFCDASSGRWDGYFEHQNLLGHESIDTT